MMNKHILSHKEQISKKELYDAYKLFFNTFSSEHRIRILNLLRKRKMCVYEIAEKTGYEQSAVSHDLSRLKKCGFVIHEVKGKYRYYKLNEITIKKILNLIDKHMKKHCLMIIKGMKGGKRK